jgi:four helix bundle protein
LKDFRHLKVWEKSHQLTLDVYKITKNFPKEELYGLTSQTRRSSASIATNIAEGCGRGSDAELGRFLQIAMGSGSELEYQLMLAHDLIMLDDKNYNRLSSNIVEVKKMLSSLIIKLKADR